MTVFNPLNDILTQNKLEGPNYVDWKRNLDIVLIVEEVSPWSLLMTFRKNLKVMFGDQNRAAKQTAMKALLNTKMVESSSIRDHILKMMSLLNKLEDLSLAKLLNELQLAETIVKQQAPPVVLNFDVGSSASSKPRGW
ncbi:PREDICTED: uncharacterized protein LOC109233626 [Nicotiana attenuata]|uniref:uncharacterized protein LOC109233626 n=1 Tax=Nicotiana attenuata TaxID=49451 RepID=UPI00090570F0|nr:PREDICTED: uncharacterized protein LOC109233626 [Nicotiana attenuata]